MSSASPAVERPLEALCRELEAALATAAPADIPEALGGLERARGRALERLVRAPAGGADEGNLLTVEDVSRKLSIRVRRARELRRRGEIPDRRARRPESGLQRRAGKSPVVLEALKLLRERLETGGTK